VSNPIRYDPLLVRYLADELNRRLTGRSCAPAPLLDALSVTLPLNGGEALHLDLHPTRGWVRLVPWEEGPDAERAECLGVACPPDERILSIRIRTRDRFQVAHRRLVIELHTNQWNALLVAEEDQRILSVLRPRTAGRRVLRPGTRYQPPEARPRFGVESVSEDAAWERWRSALGEEPPAERRSALLRGFAYTGTPNAGAVLGEAAEAAGEAPLRAAFERWWKLRALPPPRPVLLEGGQPYPVPLPGTGSRPVGSLLEAMEAAAGEQAGSIAPQPEAAPRAERVRERHAAATRKVRRLWEELEQSGEADRLREWGSLILARLHQVPRGASQVRLQGWGGEEVEIPLDPALEPTENADRWFEQARRRARAEERLPELLQEAEAEAERWGEALRAAEAGEALPEWTARALDRSDTQDAGRTMEATSLPYRRYRTSGGLEVRVGKSAKDNDELTFHGSSPQDVWLHARSVAGSHVVLRWPDSENAPPARDLAEAAGLAALFSKARSSALVPVDWTRRKYVRKPRGAPPGAVLPQRVKTLFVEPDPALEARLQAD
jgi:predicted ribosome quality control (RQC) complex YloA/Tae2 family protein